ncbi:D-glycero-beta-D-manno-heptose-7-phosphate kinase [candidate division KSB3 bacterium]|uniref:D-glycero-beta-D-manno-heptose-7-phosphate kinase n=1 Tax=candidate division KSB3 bacterium TaxID=2044937 RepID=A0A9D5Q8Y4_9BACT|nr:D-glycero-beta-D-manno-heptose-7-phosphate kinase [candidate division KSB3 bacterium]MBD3327331.1 D-glycero-beta-D-manno-heptose-7-phosphate kinase [candidate division KSB3 bacterium]
MRDVQQFQALIEQFKNTAILVVGDVMMDRYIWGKVSRISPEAPVPIVDIVSETLVPGGAANVAHNLQALGGQVNICGVLGDDRTGHRLQDILHTLGIQTEGLLVDPSRPTTLKTRIIAQHQQVVRLDREHQTDVSPEQTSRILEFITQTIPQIQGIIIEDYGKGMMTGDLVQHIFTLATEAGKIVAVDPKTNHFARYTGATIITPNHHEAGASLHLPVETHEQLLEVGKRLLETLNNDYVLITRGEEGMSLFERQTRMATHIPTMAQEVFDVTGAGDTVIAALSLGLAAGGTPIEAALLANAAAGLVVGKIGTATVSQTELQQQLTTMTTQPVDIRRESYA